VEFLRGKYNVSNQNYIQCLVNGMTLDERERLKTKTFDVLWFELWNGQNTRQYRSECAAAKTTFDTLRTSGDAHGKKLADYMSSATTSWTEPEWGFPKGRRSLHEPELTCAQREFNEETGLPVEALHMLDEEPLIEQYLGTNGIMYKQTYFISVCAPDVMAVVQSENRVMQREVSGIGWFTYDEAYGHIRETNREKRAMLQAFHVRLANATFAAKCRDAVKVRDG